MNHDTTHLEAFLDSETARLQRHTRFTWILGGAFLLILIGYFTFILRMTQTFFEPHNAAYLITEQVRTNTPALLDDAEQTLKRKAPYVAEQMSATFLSLIPRLRQTAEEQIDFTIEQMVPQLSQDFQEIIVSYIEENGPEFQQFVRESQNPEVVEAFVDELAADLAYYLENTVRAEYEGRDFAYFVEHSLQGLQAMDEHLDTLLQAGPASDNHKLRLQRKILVSLVRELRAVGWDPR